MSVNDDAEQPWLVGEKRLIAEAVRSGVPYWGVCLGVQLLAASLGARVYPGAEPEVGLLPVAAHRRGARRPGVRGAPRRAADAAVARRHVRSSARRGAAGGLAPVPASGVPGRRRARTASSFTSRCRPSLAREWATVPAYRESLERTLGPGALDRLIGELDENAEPMAATARGLFERWLAVAVTRAGATR